MVRDATGNNRDGRQLGKSIQVVGRHSLRIMARGCTRSRESQEILD